MKKRVLIVFFIICIIGIFLLANSSYAHTVDEIFSDSWLEKGEPVRNTVNVHQIKDTSKFIYKALLVIGIVVMLLIGTVLGIQFIIGGIEGKVKVKEQLIPYIIGCAVIMGAFTIWGTIINIIQGTTPETGTGTATTGDDGGSGGRRPVAADGGSQTPGGDSGYDDGYDDDDDETPGGGSESGGGSGDGSGSGSGSGGGSGGSSDEDPFAGLEEDESVIIASKPKRVERKYSYAYNYGGIPSYIKRKSSYGGTIKKYSDKRIEVYLPYDYKESREYDVFILLHGDGGYEGDWMSTSRYGSTTGKDIIDNAIANELCDPLIVVALGYTSGDATDSNAIRSNLYGNILPFIVKNFSTYVEYEETDSNSTIKEKIKEQRDHFGVAGLSRGGNVTRDLLYSSEGRDFLSWFGCLSTYYRQQVGIGPQTINAVYCAAGDHEKGSSGAYAPTRMIYNLAKESSNVKKAKFDEIEGGHEWAVWFTGLYNMLQYFFDYK